MMISQLNYCLHLMYSRDIFNKWQAQRWWAENYDKVMELYNVQRLNRQAFPLPTPARSEDEVNSHSGNLLCRCIGRVEIIQSRNPHFGLGQLIIFPCEWDIFNNDNILVHIQSHFNF